MSQTDQYAYFAQRFAEEMTCGDEAASATAAAIHYELAHRYAMIVKTSPKAPNLMLVVGGNDRSMPDIFETSEVQSALA